MQRRSSDPIDVLEAMYDATMLVKRAVHKGDDQVVLCGGPKGGFWYGAQELKRRIAAAEHCGHWPIEKDYVPTERYLSNPRVDVVGRAYRYDPNDEPP